MQLLLSCLALLLALASEPLVACAQELELQTGALQVGPDRQLVRLRFLENNLDGLARHDRDSVWSGWLQIGASLVLGGAAGFVKSPDLRGMLALSSLVSLGRGITELRFASGAEQALAELDLLGQRDVARRLLRAEQGLVHAAERSGRARIVEGSLTMFGAVAFVPLSYGLARLDDPDHRFGRQALDYVGLSLSVIGFASGLVHALVSSPAERSLERYRELPR